MFVLVLYADYGCDTRWTLAYSVYPGDGELLEAV